MDDICVLKQGFAGLITGNKKFDPEGIIFELK